MDGSRFVVLRFQGKPTWRVWLLEVFVRVKILSCEFNFPYFFMAKSHETASLSCIAQKEQKSRRRNEN